MQEGRNFTIAAFPSADGKRSDTQDFGNLALTIVVFQSPFLEVSWIHRGYYIPSDSSCKVFQ